MFANGQLIWGGTSVIYSTSNAVFQTSGTFENALHAYAAPGAMGSAFRAVASPTSTSNFEYAINSVYNGDAAFTGALYGLSVGTHTYFFSNSVSGTYANTLSPMGGIGVDGWNGCGSSTARIGVNGSYDFNNSYGVGVSGSGIGGAVPTGSLHIGVLGWVTNNANYSGYFNGNHVIANGTKSGSIPTTKGNQLLYTMESPEVWFEDLGGGTLVNGQATIQLDPLFLETVVIDNTHPMRVFIQMEVESEEVYVTKGTTSFVVKERNNGHSNAAFSYRIMAKRVHFQDHRFGNDPVWGPGDTRQYSGYSTPPKIDYYENLEVQRTKEQMKYPMPDCIKSTEEMRAQHAEALKRQMQKIDSHASR
jgi:hypothetical protein